MSNPVLDAWARHTFGILNEGGRWVHMEFGMIYAKREGAFVLVDRMPWNSKAHRCTAAEWSSVQDRAFKMNQKIFADVGIRVERAQ